MKENDEGGQGTGGGSDEGGQGTGGEPGGRNDELVDLNIGGTVHKVPKAVSQSFGTLNRDFRTLSSEMNTLKESIKGSKGAEVEELQKKIDELELQKLPEKEREAARVNTELLKLQKVHDAETKKSARYEELFKGNAINTALNIALSGHDLYQPQQALQLLKAIGKPKLIENEDGSFKIVLYMDFDGTGLQETEPKDGISKWLALPENANLLKNNLQPGAGTATKTGRVGTDGSVTYKRADLQKPEVRKERAEKIKAGISVTIID